MSNFKKTNFLSTLGPITAYGSSLWKPGLDVDLKVGDSVVSPKDGEITFVGKRGGFGNVVALKDKRGKIIQLAHLSASNVKKGDKVKAGQLLAKGGKSGSVIPIGKGDGSHLDITIYNPDRSTLTAKQVEQYVSHEPTMSISKMKDLDKRINSARKQGKTDTEIINFFASKDKDLSQKITRARKLQNDREILNFLSKKIAGKLPTVKSVPLKGQEEEQQQEVISKTEVGSKNIASDVAIGFGKKAVESFRDTSSLGEGFLKGLGRIVTPKALEEKFGFAKEETTGAERLISDEFVERTTPAQKVGAAAETVLEFFVPVGVGAKTKVAKTGVQLLKTKKLDQTAEAAQFIAGKIAQGKKVDAKKVADALSAIPSKKVKTFAELGSKIETKVSELSRAVDKFLDQDKTLNTLNKLNTVEKVGEKTVSFNYIDEALKHLDELYTGIRDPKRLEEVRQLASKAKGQGLTRREVNDLARKYGSEFKEKAFTAKGDPRTSINGQAFENIRKGIKSKARELFNDPIFQSTDKQISNLLRTKKLVGTLSESANKLNQKIMKRGVGQKAGRAIEQILNTVTAGAFRGFVQALLPRGQGLKTLNALDLEKMLNKNLKKLNQLNQRVEKMDAGAIIKALERLTK